MYYVVGLRGDVLLAEMGISKADAQRFVEEYLDAQEGVTIHSGRNRRTLIVIIHNPEIAQRVKERLNPYAETEKRSDLEQRFLLKPDKSRRYIR